jgi:hypothetical protein
MPSMSLGEPALTKDRAVSDVVKVDQGEGGVVLVCGVASVGLLSQRGGSGCGVGLGQLARGGDGNGLAEEGDVHIEVVVDEVLP